MKIFHKSAEVLKVSSSLHWYETFSFPCGLFQVPRWNNGSTNYLDEIFIRILKVVPGFKSAAGGGELIFSYFNAYNFKCSCLIYRIRLFQIELIVDQKQKLSPGVEVLNMKIHRDTNGGLGLSIAGGLESTPYKVIYCS